MCGSIIPKPKNYYMMNNKFLFKPFSSAAKKTEGSQFSYAVKPGPDDPSPVQFPDAFNPQLDMQMEWISFYGFLTPKEGVQKIRMFGLFFRWATTKNPNDQFYGAMMAVTDPYKNQHQYGVYPKIFRGMNKEIHTHANPFKLVLGKGNWSLTQEENGKKAGDPGTLFRLRAKIPLTRRWSSIVVDLALIDQKGSLREGYKGYSQKGYSEGSGSYYFTSPNMLVTGNGSFVKSGGHKYEITEGEKSKFIIDREWSTSKLDAIFKGWDWFFITLDGNLQIEFFRMRKSNDPDDIDKNLTSGKIFYPDKAPEDLTDDNIRVNVKSFWTSSKSGCHYPALWNVYIEYGPDKKSTLNLILSKPVVDQEFRTLGNKALISEVGVDVIGFKDGDSIEGSGNVELFGYARQ
jgi:predicted secreted hydrolase